jgi:hypothetical protein
MPRSDFVHFRDLDPGEPASWAGKRVLSIDIDWAHDRVLEQTIAVIEDAGVKACFFVTHATPLLARLRANPLVELGVHPNFDPLLRGEAGAMARDILAAVKAIVPEAAVLRSHAMTTSGRWLEVYREAGITRLSNYLMFGHEPVQPFAQLNGLIEAPVYFADDAVLFQRSLGAVTFDLARGLAPRAGTLQVFAFHPIHVFLNSAALETYDLARPWMQEPARLEELRHHGDGARRWLERVLAG